MKMHCKGSNPFHKHILSPPMHQLMAQDIAQLFEYGAEYSTLEPEAQVAISYGEIGLAKGGINDYLLIMFLLGGVLSFCFAEDKSPD